MNELSRRRSWTEKRLSDLRRQLTASDDLARGKACVYVSGSFGRGEASEYSDLDLFILGKTKEGELKEGKQESLLSRLDEICIKADLIKITREFKMPEFSGDGEYLMHYSVHKLTKSLGRQNDDSDNTFTARLLLLLESQALIESNVYSEAISGVVDEYWRDYDDHASCFMPAFIANDILRLWRTFCVNYEARTQSTPEHEKAKRKLKNYKLKYSRMLTCYSALLELLSLYNKNFTVSRQDMKDIAERTPTQRLEKLVHEVKTQEICDQIKSLIDQYQRFLEITGRQEDVILADFRDKSKTADLMNGAYSFGDTMSKTLADIGDSGRFYRLLIV